MPSYDFKCPECGHIFERFKSINSGSYEKCPRCGGRAKKVISAGAGLIFKGSGFYITENRSEDYKRREKEEKGSVSDDTGSSRNKSHPKKNSEDK